MKREARLRRDVGEAGRGSRRRGAAARPGRRPASSERSRLLLGRATRSVTSSSSIRSSSGAQRLARARGPATASAWRSRRESARARPAQRPRRSRAGPRSRASAVGGLALVPARPRRRRSRRDFASWPRDGLRGRARRACGGSSSSRSRLRRLALALEEAARARSGSAARFGDELDGAAVGRLGLVEPARRPRGRGRGRAGSGRRPGLEPARPRSSCGQGLVGAALGQPEAAEVVVQGASSGWPRRAAPRARRGRRRALPGLLVGARRAGRTSAASRTPSARAPSRAACGGVQRDVPARRARWP